MSSSLIYWHVHGKMWGTKTNLYLKVAYMYLHGRVQINVELRRVFFFLEDMTYTCTSFKKDLLRGVCYNIPVITSHLATRTKW